MKKLTFFPSFPVLPSYALRGDYEASVKDRKGKERKGKERKGKERKGKERKVGVSRRRR